MPLGNSLEITVSVEDIASAVAYYEKLGFHKIADDALTDGSYNLRLNTDDSPSLTLTYFGVDFDDVRAAGIPVKTTTNTATMTTPDGVRLAVCTEPSDLSMPQGTVTTRTPISKLGKFGEFSLKVKRYKSSAKFWGRLGYKELHQADIPYTYGILSDGLFLLGLHEGMTTDDIHITYFAKDMPERIKTVQQLGIDITPIFPQDDGNGTFIGMGGVHFSMFTGEI